MQPLYNIVDYYGKQKTAPTLAQNNMKGGGGVRATICCEKKNDVRLADKPWLKVLLADLLWEKNSVRWLNKYDL